jgi:pimeloyl-[acyl-carrier protein] methyl ester esterase
MTGAGRVIALGEGTPVVLLHGWSVNADFFAAQHELANKNCRLIIPDLPGHGPCATPNPTLSIAAMAVWLEAFLADLRAGPAVLVGWSMGASVAFDYLRRWGRARVASLVILDMTPKAANDELWRNGLSNGQGADDMIGIAEALAREWPRFPAAIARSLFPIGVEPDPSRRAAYEGLLAENDGPTMAALWRSLAMADHREALVSPGLPVTAILGGRSALYGSGLAGWYRRILGEERVHILPEAGHAPQIDAPDRVNALIATLALECAGGAEARRRPPR